VDHVRWETPVKQNRTGEKGRVSIPPKKRDEGHRKRRTIHTSTGIMEKAYARGERGNQEKDLLRKYSS